MGTGRMRGHGGIRRSSSPRRQAASPTTGLHRYYEFEVSLLGAEPKVWRRFLLRADGTFQDLHAAIQRACGWENCHLFVFRDGNESLAGIPDKESDKPDPDARKVRLSMFFAGPRKRCTYEYDFGDSWEHDVRLRGTTDLPETFERRVLGGARAFPPEDCGGIPGYEDCVRLATTGRGPRDLWE